MTKIADKEVVVAELTVRDIREWLSQMAPSGDDVDVVAEMLFDDCNFATIERMTNLNLSEIEEATPSELREIVREVKEVNSHFFGMAGRLAGIADQLPAIEGLTPAGKPESSSETAPPS